jgi:hypothetical protein
VALATIILDQTPPVGTILIDGGATYSGGSSTQEYAIGVNLFDAFGIARIYLDRDGVWPPAQTVVVDGRASLQATYPFPYGATSGTVIETIYGWFEDRAGNRSSSPVTDSVVLDQESPLLTDFIINGQPAVCGSEPWVNDTLLRLDLTTDAGTGSPVNRVKVGEPQSFASVSFQSFDPSQAVFYTASATNGVKQIQVAVQDGVGNVSATLTRCVLLDTQPPQVSVNAVTSSGGLVAGYTNDCTGTECEAWLTWSANDNLSTTFTVCFEGDVVGAPPSCDPTNDALWSPFASPFRLNLTIGDGIKTIIAYVRDVAKNRSLGSVIYVVVDTTAPPEPGTVLVVPGNSLLDIRWSPVPDAIRYKVYYDFDDVGAFQMNGDDADQGASPIEVVGSSLLLTGLKNILPYFVRVHAMDAAGNETLLSTSRQGVPGFRRFVEPTGRGVARGYSSENEVRVGFLSTRPTSRNMQVAILSADTTGFDDRWVLRLCEFPTQSTFYTCELLIDPANSNPFNGVIPRFAAGLAVIGAHAWMTYVDLNASAQSEWYVGRVTADPLGTPVSTPLGYTGVDLNDVGIVLDENENPWLFGAKGNTLDILHCVVTSATSCGTASAFVTTSIGPFGVTIGDLDAGFGSGRVWVALRLGTGYSGAQIALLSCPVTTDCTQSANWTTTSAIPGLSGANGQDHLVRLKVGDLPGGGFRLTLLFRFDFDLKFGVYVCEIGADACADAANWTLVTLDDTVTQNSYARGYDLVRLGDREVVLWNRMGRVEAYHCDVSCASASSWHSGTLDLLGDADGVLGVAGYGEDNLLAVYAEAEGSGDLVWRTNALPSPRAPAITLSYLGTGVGWAPSDLATEGYEIVAKRVTDGSVFVLPVYGSWSESGLLELDSNAWWTVGVHARDEAGASGDGEQFLVKPARPASQVGSGPSDPPGGHYEQAAGTVLVAGSDIVAPYVPSVTSYELHALTCVDPGCDDFSMWSSVTLLRSLNPILYVDGVTAGNSLWVFAQGADNFFSPATGFIVAGRCASNCTNPVNWSFGVILSDGTAVVGQGLAVTADAENLWLAHRRSGMSSGLFLGRCAITSDCTQTALWSWTDPGLPNDLPPLELYATENTLFAFYVSNATNRLAARVCTATPLSDCINVTNWSSPVDLGIAAKYDSGLSVFGSKAIRSAVYRGSLYVAIVGDMLNDPVVRVAVTRLTTPLSATTSSGWSVFDRPEANGIVGELFAYRGGLYLLYGSGRVGGGITACFEDCWRPASWRQIVMPAFPPTQTPRAGVVGDRWVVLYTDKPNYKWGLLTGAFYRISR